MEKILDGYKLGKPYSYFASMWLKEVYYLRFKHYCILKANCFPSQRINDPPHKLWVCCRRDNGQIVRGFCSCTAGIHQTCNHVASLLLKMERASNQACTSLPCTWIIPSKKLKIEPSELRHLVMKKPKYGETVKRKICRQSDPISEKPLSTEQWLECLKDVGKSSCFSIAHASVSQELMFEYAEKEESKSDKLLSMKEVWKNSLTAATSDEVEDLERRTKGQATNNDWKMARKNRLTASNFHEVVCKVNSLNLGKQVRLNIILDKVFGLQKDLGHLPAVKYGVKTENIAKSVYLDLMRQTKHEITARECGLFIDQNLLFLGASPDMVVYCKCCGDGVLEIKCPYSLRDTSPACSPPPYIVYEGGEPKLKTTHPYYFQVQGQMAISKTKWCDFFVYSVHGHIRCRIMFDESFWMGIKPKLRYFFNEFVAPKLL
ncbi:uncharacterized protein LOC144422063 [Styela clava]